MNERFWGISKAEHDLRQRRMVDIHSTSRNGRPSFEARINRCLTAFSGWRLGRSDGKRALLYVVGPDYRQVVLWPRAKRSA